MAAKTGQVIVGDVIRLISGSALDTYTNGSIYREGTRPRDSRKEDIVVIYSAGYSGQVQNGIVTINVFVPDIMPFDNGVMVADGARCETIEGYAQAFVDSLTAARSEYKFELEELISTLHDEDIQQAFVSIRLRFRVMKF